MKYIDIHTHELKNKHVLEIQNIFAQDFPEKSPDFRYSVGLHPWHIDQVNWDDCFRRISNCAGDKNMLFIGECGLDRSIRADFARQEACFTAQVQLSEICRKPLIIHCVRAYNDLVRIKKNTKSSVPWVIHGYSGNLQTTLRLIAHDFYFSVGEKFLSEGQKQESLRSIRVDRLFFETDESPSSIESIYYKASVLLEKDEQELISTVWNNFSNIFILNLGKQFPQ